MKQDTINYIPTNECRKIMMDILDDIDKLCQKHNIRYTLGGGSLLGAIRHKGFIPWDDDIDIFLLRDEYDKLLQVLYSDELPPHLSIVDTSTPGNLLTFIKVVDNRTMVKKEKSAVNHGIWIDIFPMENVPAEEKQCLLFLRNCRTLRNGIVAAMSDFSKPSFSKKYIAKLLYAGIIWCIGRKNWIRICNNYMQKHNTQETGVASITFSPYAREYMEKDKMLDTEYVPFEDRKYMVTRHWDLMLTRTFHNYMQLPPESERVNHGVTAWYIDRQ